MNDAIRLSLVGLVGAWLAGCAAEPPESATATSAVREALGVEWENRGQAEPGGSGLSLAVGANIAVVSGSVYTDDGAAWFVRAIDRLTGATLWEDLVGEYWFSQGKEVVVEGTRAFVAGWVLEDLGYTFQVRAYDLTSGTVAWTHTLDRGPDCEREPPRGLFVRCVAKSLAVRAGRVFVVGHLSDAVTRSDYAVLALDAATGARLWSDIANPTGTAVHDYAWAVEPLGNRVVVLGEIGGWPGGLLLRSYDARTGAVQWEQTIAGAGNFALKDTLTTDGDAVYAAGYDEAFHFMVQAFDARTGTPRWTDTVSTPDQLGAASAVTVGSGPNGEKAVFAFGVTGCDFDTGVECELALRSYSPMGALLWSREDVAGGDDWFAVGNIVATAGRLVISASALGVDGVYRPLLRVHDPATGTLVGEADFAPDGVPTTSGWISETGYANDHVIVSGRLLATGFVSNDELGTSDFVTRSYTLP